MKKYMIYSYQEKYKTLTMYINIKLELYIYL